MSSAPLSLLLLYIPYPSLCLYAVIQAVFLNTQ